MVVVGEVVVVGVAGDVGIVGAVAAVAARGEGVIEGLNGIGLLLPK